MSHGLYLGKVRLVSIEADQAHPNKMRVRGTLVQLDTPSSKPPNGAQGHRILVPTDVARRRLKTLIGMGLNYAPDLDAHAQRRKVGVIDKAWIDGNELKIEGHVWKHDFPEAEKDLKQPDLGMSMELGDVRVDNPKSDVWTLDDFQFLGATILWRDSAAYKGTHAIAARAEQRRNSMTTKAKANNGKTKVTAPSEDRIAKIAAEAAAAAVKKGTARVLQVLEANTRELATISAAQEDLSTRLDAIEAEDGSAEINEIAAEDGGEGEDVEARGKKAASSGRGSSSSASSMEEGDEACAADDEDDSSSSDSEDDEDDDEVESAMDNGDLDEEEGVVEDNAGHANEDAENRGDDGAGDLAKKVGKTVESARIKALRTANKELRTRLSASEARYQKLATSLNGKIAKLQKQVTASAERASRKSLPPEALTLLAKNNIDPADLFRTGTKMTVGEVDGIMASWAQSTGHPMKPEDRMTFKNILLRAGYMEDGRVARNVQ